MNKVEDTKNQRRRTVTPVGRENRRTPLEAVLDLIHTSGVTDLLAQNEVTGATGLFTHGLE